ncbi:hypothetical protein BT67DRAFT_194529 [Trichocladium antarcticum]|uniref:Uncharacterized protein n=1 Tax=Trichocladium antarcticum TaxID=1450529 RepID=A0AAN6UQM5_9PEZI|nr:hypothetical protein BT67DRAFT_194529 [Trichocladium antarcticum]
MQASSMEGEGVFRGVGSLQLSETPSESRFRPRSGSRPAKESRPQPSEAARCSPGIRRYNPDRGVGTQTSLKRDGGLKSGLRKCPLTPSCSPPSNAPLPFQVAMQHPGAALQLQELQAFRRHKRDHSSYSANLLLILPERQPKRLRTLCPDANP